MILTNTLTEAEIRNNISILEAAREVCHGLYGGGSLSIEIVITRLREQLPEPRRLFKKGDLVKFSEYGNVFGPHHYGVVSENEEAHDGAPVLAYVPTFEADRRHSFLRGNTNQDDRNATLQLVTPSV